MAESKAILTKYFGYIRVIMESDNLSIIKKCMEVMYNFIVILDDIFYCSFVFGIIFF